MLWVTMTMAKSCFVDQILDLGGRDWVERRARLVEQDHLGPHREGAGDAETLLLADRQAAGRGGQSVFYLGPQRGARQRPLHALVDFRARELLV
jgi:hypothetical protein